MPNTITYPPLSLKTSKELWIFWYGEEPEWSDLLVPELVKNTGKFAIYNFYRPTRRGHMSSATNLREKQKQKKKLVLPLFS